MKNLSGGNQQKVVVARWMISDARVLFFDEPASGVDVAAKVEIFQLMNNLVKQGKAVIFISSYLPEVLSMCDRVLVMCRGRITAELPRSEATPEKVLYHATVGQVCTCRISRLLNNRRQARSERQQPLGPQVQDHGAGPPAGLIYQPDSDGRRADYPFPLFPHSRQPVRYRSADVRDRYHGYRPDGGDNLRRNRSLGRLDPGALGRGLHQPDGSRLPDGRGRAGRDRNRPALRG